MQFIYSDTKKGYKNVNDGAAGNQWIRTIPEVYALFHVPHEKMKSKSWKTRVKE